MIVVAAVLIQNKKMLLAKRPQNKQHGGLWEFPGGKVQEGESHDQALARELQEELQIEFKNFSPQALGNVTQDSIELHFYQIQMEGTYSPQEHSAIAWVSAPEAMTKSLCPGDRKALETFVDHISGQSPKLSQP